MLSGDACNGVIGDVPSMQLCTHPVLCMPPVLSRAEQDEAPALEACPLSSPPKLLPLQPPRRPQMPVLLL